MHPLKKQLMLLTILRVLRMFMIAVPVIAVYWSSFELGMRDIMILQAIFAITWVVLEMPSGWLADYFGNKPIIVLGCVFGSLGYLLFWLIPSYTGFVIGEIILAIGASLLSGARDSLLHNTLSFFKRDDEYTAFQGKLTTWGHASEAAAAISASFLLLLQLSKTEPQLELVIIAELIVLSVAIPVALLLKPYRGTQQKADAFWKTVHYCFFGNKRLFWFNLFTGVVSASTLTMFWYTQLHWETLGLPLEYFGFILASLLSITALGSHLAYWIENKIRFRVLFMVAAFAPFILFGLMAIVSTSILSFCMLWLFWLLRGISGPIVSAYVQRECNEGNRATVLSANTLMGRLVFVPLSPFLGALVDTWSFQIAFIISACTFGVFAIFGYIKWLNTLDNRVS